MHDLFILILFSASVTNLIHYSMLFFVTIGFFLALWPFSDYSFLWSFFFYTQGFFMFFVFEPWLIHLFIVWLSLFQTKLFFNTYGLNDYWLTDWLTNWLTGWLTDWLTWRVQVGVYTRYDWLTDWLTDMTCIQIIVYTRREWLTDWLTWRVTIEAYTRGLTKWLTD